MTLEETRKEETAYPIWINHVEKVVSFKYAEGFTRVEFPSHEERLSFAFEKGFLGYRIQ